MFTFSALSSDPEPLRRALPVDTGATDVASVDLGRFKVSSISFGQGRLASHYHDRPCLSVILEGGFTETFPGRVVECARGSALVKPPGERHHDVFYGSRQVVVEPADPDAIVHVGRSPFEEIGHTHSESAGAVAARIAHELESTDAWTPLAIEGLALELVATVGRVADGGPAHGRLPRWLSTVRDRLAADPTPPTMSELASMAQVHPVYLGRVFRRHFGLTISAYARRLRLDLAAKQLVTTNDPLSRISFRAGFADQSHFTREFRRHFGVTPRQYRLATRR